MLKNIIALSFLFITLQMFGQNYEKQWEKVIDFEKTGSVKSALKEVDKIYTQAKRKKNEIEVIKTFFFRAKYMQYLEEDAQSKIIQTIRRDIDVLKEPHKSLIEYIYVSMLNSYVQVNNYRISLRTNTENTFGDDFKTWTLPDFDKEIDKYIQKAISNKALLQPESLEKYEALLEFEKRENLHNRSLYDFLFEKYIKLYTQNIYRWAQKDPYYQNIKKELFGTTAEFLSVSLDSVTNDNLKKAVLLYQKREREFPNNNDYKLERIVFSNNHIYSDQPYFLDALTRFQKTLKDPDIIQKVQLGRAQLYNTLASKEEHPDYKIRAIQILDSILALESRSNTYKSAFIEKHNILNKSVQVEFESYSYEGENTRALIYFQNTDSLSIKAFKVPQDFPYSGQKMDQDSLVSQLILNQKPVKIAQYKLPETKGYFSYSTEVLLPKLEKGKYLMLFDIGETKAENALNYGFITVSDLAIQHKDKNNIDYFQVIDRKSGMPIKDAIVHLENVKGKTNNQGLVNFPKNKENPSSYRNTTILITKGNDSLQVNYYKVPFSKYDDEDEEEDDFDAKIELYMDRAIYRPGQKAYIKGIVMKLEQNKKSIVPNLLVGITISDPNNNTLKEFDVTTNEFGSFTFEFDIPKNGITGQYSIRANEPNKYKNDTHPFWDYADLQYSQTYFNVEEYKRPTFKAEFDPITQDFVANQEVSVSGKVISFSGVNLSDSKVTYSVVRKSYPNYWRIFYPTETKTLTEGETTTDKDGTFTITFDAIPNSDIDKKGLPIFYYTVYADITDSRGETHSINTTVKVGYHNLQLTASLPSTVNTQQKNVLHLNSTSLNGEFLAAKGTVKIYFQTPLDNRFKARTFSKPEIPGFTDEEFRALFPYEKNETQEKAEKLIFSKDVNTETDKEIVLDFLKKEAIGNYTLVFAALDSKGNEIESKAEFKLIHAEKDEMDKLFTIRQLNKSPFADGFIELEIQSQVKDLYININSEDTSGYSLEDLPITNGKGKIKLPINDKLNNISFYFNSYFENQSFTDYYRIENTPNSEIEIETKSWRNKIEPGSEQTWSFSISKDNKALEAEVIASMYDSSLDQFSTKDWALLNINASYTSYYKYISNLSNRHFYTLLKGINEAPPYFTYSNDNVDLYWFGFDFNNPYKHLDYTTSIKASSKIPENAILVSGIITDDTGLPLPGVNIIVKGTSRGTQSDFDGFYSLEAKQGEKLEFKVMGFETKTYTVSSNIIDVSLEPGNELNNVVVTGYQIAPPPPAPEGIYVSDEPAMEKMLSGRVAGVQANQDAGIPGQSAFVRIRGAASLNGASNNILIIIDGVPYTEVELEKLNPNDIVNITILKGAEATSLYGSRGANGVAVVTTKKALEELQQVKTRTNFNETAFFYPQLKTNKNGTIEFSFTSPEALTEWKLRLLAHNKQAESGYLEKLTITQKELMIAPNMPRFFREKDSIVITARISNLTDESKSGLAMLQLFDATNMESIDLAAANETNHRNFKMDAKGNSIVSWKIYIPEGIQGIQYKVLAKAGNFTDGEENLIPVLTNNILVTESLPIWVRENSKKEFKFDKLENTTSTTLRNHQLTFEYTSNPTWLAIQALPYLMEYEHDCSEQVFARYYANAMASDILNSNPKIAAYFKENKPEDLKAMLEENEELKSIILSETPWFRDTQSEEEKNTRLALLFDLDKLSETQEAVFEKLKKQQSNNGGFPWFEGGIENEYITRHIVAGFGKLTQRNEAKRDYYKTITDGAIKFIDQKFNERNDLREKQSPTNRTVSINEIHYLYARSFYLKSNPPSEKTKAYMDKSLEWLKVDWLKPNINQKAMMALVFHRYGDTKMAKQILNHLRETSSNNEEWGMYWLENIAGWYWYQAPIETQALLIEAFDEVENDKKSVTEMKVWLLKNKQVSHWSSTKATFEAIDALLRHGKDWTVSKDKTKFKLGDSKLLDQKLKEAEKQVETGYVKINFSGSEIEKDMASLSIENKNNIPGYGGFYWQYFEELDKVEAREDQPLQVSKKLYLKKNTLEGQQLQEITDQNQLHLGDLITIRLIISSKEDMEFVHLKDMRASGLEPTEVLSKYKYTDGLGYYMSTRDAATHFFFDRIKKGTYVLEYDLRTNNIGEFSNGITTIQSMYAPEYSSHSEGIRITIIE